MVPPPPAGARQPDHPDHVHTMYTIQHFLHAVCFRFYHMIEENDNYKVMFYFLSPNVICFLK